MDPVQPLTRVSRLFFPRSAYGKRIHGRINFSYLSRRRRSIGQLITRDHWIINAGLFSKRSTRTLGGLRLSIIRLYIRPFRAENPGVDLFHARNAIIANIIYSRVRASLECIAAANLDETFESIENTRFTLRFLAWIVEEKKDTKVTV